MISPDAIPALIGIPLALVLWSLLIITTVRRAKPDPDPQWSQLDCWDGLDSRTD